MKKGKKIIIFLVIALILFSSLIAYFSTKQAIFTGTENDGIEVNLLSQTDQYSQYKFKVDLIGECSGSDWSGSKSFVTTYSTNRGTGGTSIQGTSNLQQKIYFKADMTEINGLTSVINRQSDSEAEVVSSFKNLESSCMANGGTISCIFSGDIVSEEGAEFCIKGDITSIVKIYNEGYEPPEDKITHFGFTGILQRIIQWLNNLWDTIFK